MLGERSDQRGLWEADRLYLGHVGKDTFYGLLASLRGRLFRDGDFAEFYCADNGRDSVPPSLLATALLLQTHYKVSDAEDKARADFDIRREVFESSLRLARESGYLKRRSMKVALDTTNILGRGAVKDTYNLLADGVVKLQRALAQVEGISVGKMAQGPRIRAVPCLQHQGRGRHRLVGQAGAHGPAGRDCGRRRPALGVVAAGAGGIGGGQRPASADSGWGEVAAPGH